MPIEIPRHLKSSLGAYVLTGRPTGGFLTAVLRNDLITAAVTADGDNDKILADIARFVYLYLPALCHGSSQEITRWLSSGWRNYKPQQEFVDAIGDLYPELCTLRIERLRRELLLHPNSETPLTPEVMVCPDCGYPTVKDGQTFLCRNCGQRSGQS